MNTYTPTITMGKVDPNNLIIGSILREYNIDSDSDKLWHIDKLWYVLRRSNPTNSVTLYKLGTKEEVLIKLPVSEVILNYTVVGYLDRLYKRFIVNDTSESRDVPNKKPVYKHGW